MLESSCLGVGLGTLIVAKLFGATEAATFQPFWRHPSVTLSPSAQIERAITRAFHWLFMQKDKLPGGGKWSSKGSRKVYGSCGPAYPLH